MPPTRPNPDLAELLGSWELALRAERKSPATLRVYVGGARHFLGWCADQGRPAVLDRATVTAYIADLLDRGAEGNSAKIRQQALRRFAAWLVSEGELDADPLAGLKPPRVDNKVTPVLSAAQLRALLGACQGPTFTHRRDEPWCGSWPRRDCGPARRSRSPWTTSTCAPGRP